MLLHWYGVEPGGWTMEQYFERLERIEDIREMTEDFDRKNPTYTRAKLDRMERRHRQGLI